MKNILTGLLLLLSAAGAAAQTDTTDFAYQKPLFGFNYEKPVFKLTGEQAVNKNRMLHFFAVTGYREGVKPVNMEAYGDQQKGTVTYYRINISIQAMLIDGFMAVPSNRVMLEVKDPSKYRYDPKYGDKKAWMQKNAKCFEFTYPIGATANPSKYLKSCLDYIFDVKSSVEKRMINTLVLVRTSDVDKLKSVDAEETRTESEIFKDIAKGLFLRNSLDWLGDQLEKAGLPPFIDESGYKNHVDMDLQVTDWRNLPALRKALLRYDLDLKEEKREMDVLVIRENNYKPSN